MPSSVLSRITASIFFFTKTISWCNCFQCSCGLRDVYQREVKRRGKIYPYFLERPKKTIRFSHVHKICASQNKSLNFYPFPLLGVLINYFFFQWRSDLEEESSHPPAQALSLVHQVELVHKLKQNKNIQTNLTRHSEEIG